MWSAVEHAAHEVRLDMLVIQMLNVGTWPARPSVCVDPTVGSASRARTSLRQGPAVIRVHPRVLGEPDAVQRGTIAHELAHVQAGPVRGWLLPLWGSMVVLCAALVGYGVLTSRGGPTIALLAALCLIVVLYVCVRVAFAPQRRCEYDADDGSLVFAGFDAVSATLRHLNGETPAFVRAALAAGLGTHPSPGQRLRRIRRTTGC